jgi:hypothetical protein
MGLLSRGSRVRVAAGALFPKEFSDFACKKIRGRSFIEQSDRSREFAALLSIPLETYRPWDSGRRVVSAAVLQRAREAVVHHQRQFELLSLDQLARELHVHLRTLQAAARTGRLEAHFSVRSAFGRPIRGASRAAGAQFMAKHYRCFSGQEVCPLPLPLVPDDYDDRLRDLRRRMRLTQGLDGLARPVKPSCISGNRKSGCRRLYCGRASRLWTESGTGERRTPIFIERGRAGLHVACQLRI